MPKRKGHHQGNRLTPVLIRNIDTTKPGLHWDGYGLALQVSKYGTLSWLFLYMEDGKQHKMGLGALHDRSLAEARKRAAEIRLARLDGVDPIANKRQRQAKAKLESAKAVTFKACAEAYIAANRAGWSAKHSSEWPASLATHVYPTIGNLPVASIDVALVTKVLEPIWQSKTTMASRLRGRIELILDYAKARGHRDGANPAAWKGSLKAILPPPRKVSKVEHHPALPVDEVPAFMAELRDKEGVAARALEFAVLTAARLGEVLGATWSEFDLAKTIWTVPSSRMKGNKEHSVPLAPHALTILESLPRDGDSVFAVSPVTVQRLMRSMRPGVTLHGTARSSFRDFAGDRTTFPREVAEAALAHVVGGVEGAYRRSNALAKRRELMTLWSDFCERGPVEGDNVVDIASARAS
jgi:integrase